MTGGTASVASRVLAAVSDEIADRAALLEALAAGTISIIVKIDSAGCPRQIQFRTDATRVVERRRAAGV